MFRFFKRSLSGLAPGLFLVSVIASQSMLSAQGTSLIIAPTNAPAASTPDGIPGVLNFFDGSSLHGSLQAIERQKGIGWQHPAAQQVIELRPDNIANIRFERPFGLATAQKSKCRFKFQNGDEIYGNLTSLKDGELQFGTWFGADLKTSETKVQSIIFSTKGFATLYEGPTGTNGWNMGNGPKKWLYRDGVFTSTGADILGRDFGVQGSSSLEFDLAWNSTFSLSITLYTEVIDRFDFTRSAYLLYLAPGAVTAQKIQQGVGSLMLGQAQIPSMLRKNKVRFEIRASKEDSSLTLFADGMMVQRWRDPAGFTPKGSGFVFFSQMESQALRLSNIKVSEWDGKIEPEETLQTDEDVIYLANRDKIVGKVQSIDSEKLGVLSRQNKLEVPLQRVTQLTFGRPKTNAVPRGSWEIQARFSGGEAVALELAKWNDQEVSGKSANFGEVSFPPNAIRELKFNLDRLAAPGGGVSAETWEFDE